MTTYSLALRIRAIAEHSMTRDPSDPFQNARTTLASWWERLLFAPNYVNYHLEHHLLMTVPHYRLPDFHRMLRDRGLLADANLARGYARVLKVARTIADLEGARGIGIAHVAEAIQYRERERAAG